MESFATLFYVIALVLLVVVLLGLLVAVEAAAYRASIISIKEQYPKNSFLTRLAERFLDQLDRNVFATQLLIIVSSLFLGWWGIDALTNVIGELSPAHLDAYWLAPLILILVAMSYFVIGELVARHIAARNPEETLRVLSGPMLIVSWCVRPLLRVAILVTNLLLKVFGVTLSTDLGRVHSARELARLITESTAQGELDKEEEEMLRGVFGFAETVAREVMTPRPDLIVINEQSSLEEVIKAVSESGLSRFPVVRENVDHVVGILLAKDIMSSLDFGVRGSENPTDEFSVRQIMREPYFIPGSKLIGDLLGEFKKRKLHMAIVLDEHGGVDGVVTLEDLIEEIFGEIFDESDEAEYEVVELENGHIVVDGGLHVADFNARLSLQIPEGDYDTVAGFIFSVLGRVPRVGEDVVLDRKGVYRGEESGERSETHSQNGLPELNGGKQFKPFEEALQLVVEKVEGNRIEQVRVKSLRGLKEDFETPDPALASQQQVVQLREE